MEPDYLAQTAEKMTIEEGRAWYNDRADEAKARGMTWGRYSYDDQHGIRLVEGWKVRPEDEGQPRFQFTAAPS